ncbi:DUF1541 domain-containing protein [Priestia sp. SIMBA_032]|uniref:DUF1541 domain-containing protein n=1 Tax=Priestia sp. SIMBA_032 TaxID=3085775 RepID=UPI00397AA5E3
MRFKGKSLLNKLRHDLVGACDITVYTISYIPTTGGEKEKNYKWVTENELSAKQNLNKNKK